MSFSNLISLRVSQLNQLMLMMCVRLTLKACSILQQEELIKLLDEKEAELINLTDELDGVSMPTVSS